MTPTLEAQQQGGWSRSEFEAAYLRALDFESVPEPVAAKVYASWAGRGAPPHADYKALQDFLFRYLAREAGRLGMAVHIHSFEGVGNYYDIAGANPALLEPVLNDPALHATNFVVIHGGGSQASHTTGLLWKPNVYADISLMTQAYPPAELAAVLKPWLATFPEKVLFGCHRLGARPGPGLGGVGGRWHGQRSDRARHRVVGHDGRRRDHADRAQEIATLVLRGNASRLEAGLR